VTFMGSRKRERLFSTGSKSNAYTDFHHTVFHVHAPERNANSGVPMLPVVAGVRETKKQMLIYTVLLFPLAIAPYWLGVAGPLYGMAATVLGGLFLLSAIAVWRDAGDRAAKRMFGYSIFYLFAIFGAMILDRGTGLLG